MVNNKSNSDKNSKEGYSDKSFEEKEMEISEEFEKAVSGLSLLL